MKNILLVLALIIFLIVVFIAFSENGTGYLKHDIKTGTVEVYFGTEIRNGRVYVWSDRINGELYSGPDKKLQNGFASAPASLNFTGKNSEGLYEAAVCVDFKEEILSETLQESLKEYEKMYYEQCSTCHAAADFNRFGKERWESILKSMQQHSGISDKDLTAIRRYILLSITN